jgi:CelD/BcsL family acetyltransferase involved in cellulose biosynthesis
MLQLKKSEPHIFKQVLDRRAVAKEISAWESLCARTIEDNVYYSPRYATALLTNIDRGQAVRFASVWKQGALIGLLPFTHPTAAAPLLGTTAYAWQTPYTFGCTPLLDSTCADDAAQALLSLLCSVHEGEWVIPLVHSNGLACQGLISALEAAGWPWRFSDSFERAILETRGDFDDYMRQHVSSKRRRDLARNRRRLEECGPLAHEIYQSGEGLTRAVQAFLAIESGGWKGRRGTALACRPQTKKFALDAFTGNEAASICRADILSIAGRPIAASLIVHAGRTGFTVKCAYDEAYRSFSAGLLLELEVIRSLFETGWVNRLDSATAGPHVIDSLWSGRLEMADLLFSFAPHGAERLAVFAAAKAAKSIAKKTIKNVIASWTPL